MEEENEETSERDKPTDADEYGWDAFETLAFEEGVGNYTEDWISWWRFWKKGYETALEEDE
jgi:hypothetical protein